MAADDARQIATHLADMLAAEAEHARRPRYEPLRCNTCGLPNGPHHSTTADFPAYTCDPCRARLADYGDH